MIKNKLLEAAQIYIENGFQVFPCRPGEKTPLIAGGFKAATNNPTQILYWWTKWPNANIGLATNDIWVLDIDGKDNEFLQKEEIKHLLRNINYVSTPNGYHYYFSKPPDKFAKCSVSQIAPNVDIRAELGYIIAPPSIVNGKTYQWIEYK